jgi:TolB-like protein
LRRKLAAILIADVAGYSSLMSADEGTTQAAFNRLLKEQIRPGVKEHHGRLIKNLGDGVLVEFNSAVDAVMCAVALQKGFAKRNKRLAPSRQLWFRIGINLGDVMLENDDVFGDGVNIAKRIQGLADPGGIMISQTVVQHVRGKVPVTFEDCGERYVKNIGEPIHIFRVIDANSGPRATRAATEASVPDRPSIAILPFVNLSEDQDQQYYSDGITEDIITELSRFRTISVIARTSSFAWRNQTADVHRIGQQLNVQFLVEGSVRRLDNRVRITVQLINCSTQHHVWADRYDVDHSAIFDVQDDVTRRIVATLVPKIEIAELELRRRHPTGHPSAYDCYLRGKATYFAATDGSGIEQARTHFEKAVAIDPRFAAAYCYLAAIENTMTKYSLAGTPLAPFRQRAWDFARKAEELDDSDPHTHITLAWCHLWRREFEPARKHLDLATQLNPNDADRALDRGTTLMYLGEPEKAIEVMEAGIRLNPFHPDSYLADLAEAFFAARRYDEMIRIADTISDPTPQFSAWKAAACAHAGHEAEARKHARTFIANVASIWAGDPAAGPGEYVAWLLGFCPFRREADLEHLVAGLRSAGLDASPAIAAGRSASGPVAVGEDIASQTKADTIK